MLARAHDLGELQLAILNVLWTRQHATVHEVLKSLTGGRTPAYTTVLTVLRTLEKRGLVAHEAVEGHRMYRYRALVSAHDARGRFVSFPVIEIAYLARHIKRKGRAV